MCEISASGRGDSIHSKWLAGKSGDVGFGGALKARGTKLTRVELGKVGFAHGNQNVFKNRGQGEPKLEFSIPGHFWSNTFTEHFWTNTFTEHFWSNTFTERFWSNTFQDTFGQIH